MSKNIFAYTEPTPDGGYPGFLSINRDQNGVHSVTVRARGDGGRQAATIELTPQMLEAMATDLYADLYRDEKPATALDPAGIPKTELTVLEREAVAVLNTVKAWRDCEGNDGFPHEARERIYALLMTFEQRRML